MHKFNLRCPLCGLDHGIVTLRELFEDPKKRCDHCNSVLAAYVDESSNNPVYEYSEPERNT